MNEIGINSMCYGIKFEILVRKYFIDIDNSYSGRF